MLTVLGLEDDEELTYRALVAVASADVDVLATQLRQVPAETRRVLGTLEQKGLVARSGGDEHRYVASPPTVALRALAVQRQMELRAAGAVIAELAETYRGARGTGSVGDLIDVIHGPQAVAQRFHQLQSAARREVVSFVRSEVVHVTAEANTAEDEAVARGVTYRVVVERAVIDGPGFLAAAEGALANGELVRVVPELPIRLVIVDQEIALVPMVSGDGERGALLVHTGGLLDGLLALFERVWRDAMPLTLTADGVVESSGESVDDVDLKIFGLLLAGLTDQAVGSHLGLSLRTVQRRVRLLMDIAGVDTRLQLGFLAARRGWVGSVAAGR